MRLTTTGKVVLLLLVVGVVTGVWRLSQRMGGGLFEKLAPSARVKEAVVPAKADLPPVGGSPTSGTASNAPVTLPGTGPGCTNKPEVRMLVWAWNAQMGAMLANGGPQATAGSLMCKHGVDLKLIREDDSGKMQEALVAFATDLSRGNPNPSKGAHFVGI